MNSKIYFSLIILLLILGSCNSDDDTCATEVQGEHYELSDTSKSYVDIYNSTNRVVFKDLSDLDIPFIITRRDSIFTIQSGQNCTSDSSQIQQLIETSETIHFSLANSDININPFVIGLYEFPNYPNGGTTETVAITINEWLLNGIESVDELFHYKINKNNNQVTFSDSLILNGKTFYSVYEMSDLNPQSVFQAKYTMDEGIVYIKNNQSDEEYIFDRFE